MAEAYVAQAKPMTSENPYGVPITRGSWAGNGVVMSFGIANFGCTKIPGPGGCRLGVSLFKLYFGHPSGF